MKGFFWNILLAIVWVLITGSFEFMNYVFGFMVGYVVIAFVHRIIPPLADYPRRVPRALAFLAYFLKELIKANIKVGVDIVTPPWHMRPGVIGIDLDARTDLEVTLVANIISLTPGTLSLEVSADKRTLFVHTMFLEDEAEVRADLKQLEQRLLAVVR